MKGVRRAVQVVAVRTNHSPAGVFEALAAAEVAPLLLSIDAVSVALVLDGESQQRLGGRRGSCPDVEHRCARRLHTGPACA